MGDTSIPIEALRQQIASSIHLVIQVKRFQDGTRKISNISEITGVSKDGIYQEKDIFRFVQKGKAKNGILLGSIEATGYIPSFMYEIEVNGYPFPKENFSKIESTEEEGGKDKKDHAA